MGSRLANSSDRFPSKLARSSNENRREHGKVAAMPKYRKSQASKALSIDELSSYFHLPINEVASKLGLCVTVLKQRCRENGITRWPYRKLRKLDNIINALEGSNDTVNTTEVDAKAQLNTIKETRDFLLNNPNSTAHLKLGKLKPARRLHPANTARNPLVGGTPLVDSCLPISISGDPSRYNPSSPASTPATPNDSSGGHEIPGHSTDSDNSSDGKNARPAKSAVKPLASTGSLPTSLLDALACHTKAAAESEAAAAAKREEDSAATATGGSVPSGLASGVADSAAGAGGSASGGAGRSLSGDSATTSHPGRSTLGTPTPPPASAAAAAAAAAAATASFLLPPSPHTPHQGLLPPHPSPWGWPPSPLPAHPAGIAGAHAFPGVPPPGMAMPELPGGAGSKAASEAWWHGYCLTMAAMQAHQAAAAVGGLPPGGPPVLPPHLRGHALGSMPMAIAGMPPMRGVFPLPPPPC